MAYGGKCAINSSRPLITKVPGVLHCLWRLKASVKLQICPQPFLGLRDVLFLKHVAVFGKEWVILFPLFVAFPLETVVSPKVRITVF